MKKKLTIILFTFLAKNLFAQHEPSDTGKLTVGGYAEIYYGYDFNQPKNNMRPPFVYNYTRTNEVNLNLGFIKAAYAATHVRANVALMAGTYANANLAAEPGVLKNIYEANVGIKLTRKADLWLDAGIFSSHIGFESVVATDCWNLTRSIAADNSPYYESGANLNYTTADGKWYVSALLLNGWQHIQRPDGNTSLSGGLQVTWQPSADVTVNYSNFYGNDKPDSVRRERFYNDFYGIFKLGKKLGLTIGVDYAVEQKSRGSSAYNKLVAPLIIMKYEFTKEFAMAARFEYYQDPSGILIPVNTADGFKTTGYSLNADCTLYKNVLLRIEGKYYNSEDAIFIKNDHAAYGDFMLTTSLSVAF